MGTSAKLAADHSLGYVSLALSSSGAGLVPNKYFQEGGGSLVDLDDPPSQEAKLAVRLFSGIDEARRLADRRSVEKRWTLWNIV